MPVLAEYPDKISQCAGCGAESAKGICLASMVSVAVGTAGSRSTQQPQHKPSSSEVQHSGACVSSFAWLQQSQFDCDASAVTPAATSMYESQVAPQKHQLPFPISATPSRISAALCGVLFIAGCMIRQFCACVQPVYERFALLRKTQGLGVTAYPPALLRQREINLSLIEVNTGR